MIMLTEFVNSRALTEIVEPAEKIFSSLYSTGKAGKNHDDVGMHHQRKVFDATVEPGLIYAPHCWGCTGRHRQPNETQERRGKTHDLRQDHCYITRREYR